MSGPFSALLSGARPEARNSRVVAASDDTVLVRDAACIISLKFVMVAPTTKVSASCSEASRNFINLDMQSDLPMNELALPAERSCSPS